MLNEFEKQKQDRGRKLFPTAKNQKVFHTEIFLMSRSLTVRISTQSSWHQRNFFSRPVHFSSFYKKNCSEKFKVASSAANWLIKRCYRNAECQPQILCQNQIKSSKPKVHQRKRYEVSHNFFTMAWKFKTKQSNPATYILIIKVEKVVI